LSKHRFSSVAHGCLQLSGVTSTPDSFSRARFARLRHAAIASVLALYPSTTTEIPFT
jgi:hypothetical protein